MRALLLGMILLCLNGCATSPTQVAAPATDLLMLKLGMDALTQPRTVASPIQHPEQATDDKLLFNLSMAQDDTIWMEEGDKLRLRHFYTEGIRLIVESMAEKCRWWQLRCRDRNRAALAAFGPPESPGEPRAGAKRGEGSAPEPGGPEKAGDLGSGKPAEQPGEAQPGRGT